MFVELKQLEAIKILYYIDYFPVALETLKGHLHQSSVS